MVGDRAGAMFGVMDEAMDEARHDGAYRRIEVITGRRQRRNWTDEEKARILADSAEPDVNISAVARRWGVNRDLLNVWRREAELTSRRSAQAGAQQAMFADGRRRGHRQWQRLRHRGGRSEQIRRHRAGSLHRTGTNGSVNVNGPASKDDPR